MWGTPEFPALSPGPGTCTPGGKLVNKYLHPKKGLVASACVSTDFIIKRRLGLTPKSFLLKKDVVPVGSLAGGRGGGYLLRL